MPVIPLSLAVAQTTEPPMAYTGGGIPKGMVMIVVGILLYLLPSMLAFQRSRHRRGLIVLINLLLGWTILGWIAAMVMTFRYEPPPEGEVDEPHRPGRG